MLRPVVQYPDPLLRHKTRPVSLIGPEVRQLIQDLCETMYARDGVGMAAIQIGALERIFVVDSAAAGFSKKEEPLVFINPTLEWASPEMSTMDEGCLSFPGVIVPVSRPLRVVLKAIDPAGKGFYAHALDQIGPEVGGLFARILQHEFDHLENRLLYDHAGPFKRRFIEKRLK